MGAYYGNPWLHQSDINKIHSEERLHREIADLVGQRETLVSKLSSLPKTKEDGTTPNPDYTEAFNALRNIDTGLRTRYDPANNPGAIEKFGHLLTDHLGIKVKEKGKEGKVTLPQLRKDKAAAKEKTALEGDTRLAQTQVAAGPLSPEQQAGVGARGKLAEFNANINSMNQIWDNAHKNATEEEKSAAHSENAQNLMLKDYGTTGRGSW